MTEDTTPPPTPPERDLPGPYITGASGAALGGGFGIAGWETLHTHNPFGYTFAAFLILMGFGMRRAALWLIRRQ